MSHENNAEKGTIFPNYDVCYCTFMQSETSMENNSPLSHDFVYTVAIFL